MLSRFRLVRLYERLGFRSVAVYGNTRRTTRQLNRPRSRSPAMAGLPCPPREVPKCVTLS